MKTAMKKLAVWLLAAFAGMCAPPAGDQAEVLELRRVWSQAPHNAFTDLARFRDRWYLAFREGSAHVSPDGAIRILTSADGERWLDAALLKLEGADLRDPKLTVTPRQTLILSTAAAYPQGSPQRHQTLLFFSTDGRDWSKPVPVGDPNIWMWRIAWSPRNQAFSIGYSTWGPPLIRLYTSKDGIQWTSLVDELLTDNFPNESVMLFDSDDIAHCLLRRDKGPMTALLGISRPPYRAWEWRDLGVRLGGPNMIRLPDGRVVAAGRLYDGKPRTSLAWLDFTEAKLAEFLALPSGGDCSYPGLVFYDGLLWVSYYSSHEGKTSVYLAKVKLPTATSPARKSSWMPPKKY